METTWERRQAGSAHEELIGCACAQTSLETQTVPALEDCSTWMGIQGVCGACVNGELERGTWVQGRAMSGSAGVRKCAQRAL